LVLTLLLLISAQTQCRAGVAADGGVVSLSIDLDGDSTNDWVKVLGSQVEIGVSKPPKRTKFDLSWESPNGLMVPLAKLPLRGTRHREEALRFIEDAAFWNICTSPDASLKRLLLQKEARGKKTPLEWIEGPPQPIFSYVLRRNDSWLLYLPYCFRRDISDPFGPTPLEFAASDDGDFVALKTCHGVVLTNSERTRHAWLYMLDQHIEKLRHQSIGEVTIANGVVSIRLTLIHDSDSIEVQVRISDGSLKVVKEAR
jgi:hypothetical protein